ncbi:uncharacterized protein [Aristolochia californica]|uniref:uncharacterized protein n=1 Tax=Aristolochia californica TaxID=171875 RepID=UPI0035DACF63
MAATIELPKEYGYVVLTLAAYVLLNFWMARQVGNARKKYKVFYPTMYASESENKDAKAFNCVQRGHQNALEMAPMFFVLLLLGGLKHPLVSTGFGIVYVIARYFYFIGYSTGDPKNRLKIGGISFPALFGLVICTISLGVSLVRG